MRALRILTLAALLLVPAIAHAGPGTCTMMATNINFGTFTGTQVTGTGSITLVCSGGSNNNTVQIGLSFGSSTQNFPNSTANRMLHNGSNILVYQIYTTSAHTTIWGDGSGGTSRPTINVNYAAGNPPVTVVTVTFGVLFSGTLPAPGEFTDLITATLFGANPVTTTFMVIVNMPPLCSITANNLNFGNYSAVQLDGTTTLSATCASGTPYNIGLNQGVSTGATVTTRAMTGPGSTHLNYGLFQDTGRTTNWGNTVGTDTVASTGTGVAQSFTVFGRIPSAQFVGPGSYQDTITATLTF